jgi:hypothetical protein
MFRAVEQMAAAMVDLSARVSMMQLAINVGVGAQAAVAFVVTQAYARALRVKINSGNAAP